MRKNLMIVVLLTVLLRGLGLVRDFHTLHNDVIRLHVVGASDSEADQAVKLEVKDAVNRYLQDSLQGVASVDEAKSVLKQELPALKTVAREVLLSNGFCDEVSVSLTQESFLRREYDTFTLPSGVYHSLRIRIGNAEGKNWWCVVFPTLCLPTTGEDLRDVAAGAGFSESLADTLTGEEDYEIRFFLLDWLGQIQNFWFEE